MTTRILVLADTHLPARARDLPTQVWDEVDATDLVVHAGDWVSVDALDTMLDRVGGDPSRLVGVAGNNDGPELHARLPLIARVTVERVRIAVVHETGAATGRESRAAARFGGPAAGPPTDPAARTDLLVFGHSHIPWDTTASNGLRLLNPGSPTDRRRQPVCTYLTLSISDDEVMSELHAVAKLPGPITSG